MRNFNTTSGDYEGYARVNTNAATRLTVSTFLASICLSLFAIFLPTAIHINVTDPGSYVILVSESSLGAASVFFLAVAYTMSIVLTRFGQFSFSVRKSLSEGTPTSLNEREKDILVKAVGLYDRSVFVMYWGLILVLLSLLLLGFHVNAIIGGVIAAAFIPVVIRLRKFLGFALRG